MPKINLDFIWEEYPKTYPSGVDVSRRIARRIAGGIPRCGYEIEVARRIHNGYEQIMWLQNISNAVFRFRVYTSPVSAYAMDKLKAAIRDTAQNLR